MYRKDGQLYARPPHSKPEPSWMQLNMGAFWNPAEPRYSNPKQSGLNIIVLTEKRISTDIRVIHAEQSFKPVGFAFNSVLYKYKVFCNDNKHFLIFLGKTS